MRPSSLPSDFEQTLTQQGFDAPLVHALVQLFEEVILDNPCRNGESHGTSTGQQLHDLMCQFATRHAASALTPEDQMKNNELTQCAPFSDGQYGTVFMTEFKGKPILTKTTKTFNVDMIREVFINMIIINSFLLHDQLTSTLVPTVGMYVVHHDNHHHQRELYINMVQMCIEGDTLYHRLMKNGITLNQLKEVIGQLFSALVVLQESPFHLRHNDLHTKNVIVTTTNKAYIIDYGLSTFTYGNFYDLREDNTLENHYYHYEDYRKIGALDMFHIFYTIRDNASKAPESYIRTEIVQYATDMLQRLVYDRFYETETEHINIEHMIRIIGYDYEPIRDINWFYYLLDGIDKKAPYLSRQSIHNKNIDLLRDMTYRWFLTNFCTEPEYKVKWDKIDIDVSRFEPLIPIPKELGIRNTEGTRTKTKKKRAPSHKKRKPSDRKRAMSHKKRHNSRKKVIQISLGSD